MIAHERERMTKMMICVHCNRNKAWTDAFPSSTYAVCWQCTWEQHHREQHAPKRRWWRRSKRAA